MSSFTRAMWLLARVLFAACVTIVFTTCTMSDAPTSPRSAAAPSRLALRPQFTIFGGAYDSQPINRIHLVARVQPAQTVVADTVLNVQPNDASWSVGVDIRLPDGQESASVIVTIELINVSGGVSTVEWSGVTDPIAVNAGGISSSPPPVPVFPGPPANLTITSVTASPESVNLVEGDSASFVASVDGASGTPLVIWSTLDPSIAAVSASGSVRGLRNGTARVVAQAGPRADTVIAHFAQRPASLNVQQDSVVLNSFGQEASVSVLVADPRGDSIPAAVVTYSTRDGGVAEITGAGRVRSRANGRTYLYATSGVSPVLRDSALVVVAQRIAAATVTPPSATLSAFGLTTQFSASGLDANNNAVAAAAAWSSDNVAVATVDANGLARAVSNGTARISAAYAGGATAVATLTVAQQPTSVALNTSSLAFIAFGDTSRLRATVRDANANEMPSVAVTWVSSDPAIASVDGNGLVRAVGAGSVTVTARAGLLSAAASVTVTQRVALLAVSPRSATLSSIGEVVAVTATATDARGAVVAHSALSWSSSNPAVASVTGDGSVTATGNGSATITAVADGVRDSALITVRQTAAHIALAASPDSLTVGDSIRLQPTAFDATNTPISGALFTWRSSAPSVASVNNAGTVRALAPGTVDITAESDGTGAVKHLRVVPAGSPNLVMAPFTIAPNDTLREGTPGGVGIRVRNSGSAASSATMVHLRLKASAAGPVLVTDSAAIPPIQPGDSILIGRFVALDTVTQYPDSVFALVEVDAGNLVAESVETDNSYGRTLFIALNVAAVHIRNAANTADVDSLSFDALGDTVQLAYRAFDRFNRPITGRPIFWAVMNPPAAPPVAFVNGLGRAYAVGNGTAQITLQIGIRKDTAIVRVIQLPTSMTVFPDSLHMRPGDSAGVNVQGVDRTNVAVQQMPAVLTSSNTAVATIDSVTRKVHAIGNGFAVVHVNSGVFHDSVLVYVATPPPVLPAGASIPTKTWLGLTPSWSDPANWAPAGVPSASDTVLIATGVTQPHVTSPTGVGGIVVTAGAQLTLDANLSASGGVVASGSIAGTSTLVLDGVGTVRGSLPDLFVNTTRTVDGSSTIHGHLTIAGGNLIVAAPLAITGNVTWDSYGLLTMNNPLADITVDGDFYLNRYNGQVPDWSAGTLRVKGNFATGGNSSEALRASGSHRVIFNGTAPQTISIAYGNDGRHYFRNIEFDNPTGVTIATPVWVEGQATVISGTVTSPTISHVGSLVDAAGNRWLFPTTHILSSTPTLPALLTSNLLVDRLMTLGSDIVITGNVTLNDGADFRLGGHAAHVSGHFTLDSYGMLRMDNANDVLDVAGNIYMNRYNGAVPVLSAGEIRVQGNFQTGGNSSEVFRATGTHKVIFNGTTHQTVALAYGGDGRHYFNNIEFSNPQGVEVLGPIWIDDTGTISAGVVTGVSIAHVRNAIMDAVGSRWQIANNRLFGPVVTIPTTVQGNLIFNTAVALGTNVHVTGNVTLLDGADLQLSGRTLRVDTDFLLDSNGLLTMNNTADVLDVGRDVYFNRYNSTVPVMSAGEIRVQRNFGTGGNSSEVFRPSGSHRVTFNGTGRQTISLAYGDDGRHYFDQVEFANPDSVHVLAPVWINDAGTITAGKVVGNTVAHVRNGIFDAVGNRWQIANNRMFGPNVVIPTTIQGNLFFNTVVALDSNIHATGNVTLYDGADLRLNGHTLRVDGNFTLDSNGLLQMSQGADVLDVRNDFYLNRYNSSVPVLTAGEIRIRGNFATGGNSSEVLRPSGTHKIIFDGTGRQAVSLAYGDDERHYFNKVEFANPDSVVLTAALWVNGSAIISSGKVVGATTAHLRNGLSDAVGNRWRVALTHFLGVDANTPIVITGAAYFNSAVTLQHDLTTGGDVSLYNGALLQLSGHNLTTGGNFLWDSNGLLLMDHVSDVLAVDGFFYMNRYDGTVPTLSAGEIRVRGNFSTGGNSSEVLRPTGTHRFVFDGTAPQTIALAYGYDGRHFFRNVDIRNTAGVTFAASGAITGNLNVAASPSGSRFNVGSGVTVDVNGALSLFSNSVVDNAGVLKYGTFPANLGTITGFAPIPR